MRAALAAIAFLWAPQEARWPDPETARRRFQLAPGIEASLWAADPHVQNPVAIAFDERGRLYVAEDFRRHTSLLDIHMRREWLDDDLACRRHEDLVAYHRKRLGEKAGEWEVESERIRLVEDRDGDGKADAAVVFSDGYRALGEGVGAGVLARAGEVWYTCIPNLWLLRDADGDGKADVRRSLHFGYGVHLGANGHDMHGLRFGPDGKLYFSHGDRGFRVETEGKVLDFPDGGGVLRCNPDGSGLEIVCVGLRNPQELAFDAYGNLFTGDNNISIAPDVGETCRWTYVVEGADYGWRIGYQFMPKGGAWCQEEQWRLEAGFQVAPVARLGHGPSGVTVHPGVAAIPERYRDHFFMCDYPGGIYAFRMEPKGAGFEMAGLHKLLWEITAPDVEFGPDGALYAADWVGLWDKTDKGRIWRLAEPGAKDPAIAEVKRLIAEGMSKRPAAELLGLLAHRDQRIRQEAQFELAARKDWETLRGALGAGDLLARIHAVWGLGQIGRSAPIAGLLGDLDPEIRAQAARTLGSLRAAAAYERLLADPSPRVRYFAAMGIGKAAKREAFGAVVDFLRANDGSDRFLQHAGIMALAGMGDVPAIAALRGDPSKAVRTAAVVALRKLRRAEVSAFVDDPDPRVALEAARAIYDEPIPEAMAALVREIRSDAPERLLLRQVNAAFRLGRAEALAVVAADRVFPAAARLEAMRILAEWDRPSGRDRLIGVWRPVQPRDRAEAARAAGPRLAEMFLGEPEIAAEAARLTGALGIDRARLRELARDPKAPGPARAQALAVLGEVDLVASLLGDPDADVVREAVRWVPKAGLGDGVRRLERLAAEGALGVRQAAVTALGEMGADEALLRLFARGVPAALELEVREANRPAVAAKLAARDAGDPLADWRECLEGGDARAGRVIFHERGDVQCVRCHTSGEAGGEVGPSLAKIGAQKTREYLLEALVLPNRQIAEGWGQTAFQLESGAVEVGRVEKEDEREVQLLVSDGKRRTIAKSQVKARKPALSAMPEDAARQLSKRDLRDLVEFLSQLR
jgi:quinoprotein glucose dehydrogenase